jgi:hypothetical protein
MDAVRTSCGAAARHGTEAAGLRAVAPYIPRAAADTVLHGVVQENLETFLAAAAARTDGVGLPHFIEREFRGFLRCGLLVHGFLRIRCDDCGRMRVVATIKDPLVIRKILTHLGLPTAAPAPRPPPSDLFDWS